MEKSPTRVGVLGGSFNPAHEGHRAISLYALGACGLDWIWWMLAPSNPFKAPLEPLDKRLAWAKTVSRHRKIIVTDIESLLRTGSTADTLKALRTRFPRVEFLFLMGSDVLPEFTRWRRWKDVFEFSRVAIFRRWPYHLKTSTPLQRFREFRSPNDALIMTRRPPYWVLLNNRFHSASSRRLRQCF